MMHVIKLIIHSLHTDHRVTFKFFGTRLSCFAHTLQLVVHKFDEDKTFRKLLNRTFSLVKKVNRSSKATEKLLTLCHKKLVGNCPTRWSSTYLLIVRLLEVKMPLIQVLEEIEWDNLAVSEWRMLESIQKLLHPFAQYTSLVGGEEYTTISCVVPVLMELGFHLDEMKKIPEISKVSHLLHAELIRRFRKLTHPDDPDYEPIYLVSTMCDPQYRLLLNATQADSAKVELLRYLNEANNEGSTSSSSAVSGESEIEEMDEPPKKRFHHVYKVLEEKLKEKATKVKIPPGKHQLEKYLVDIQTISDDVDPLNFWVEEKNYPLLSSVAVDVLVIPATSTPIERAFSTACEVTGGKRNRLADKNLEREVLLRKNKEYILL